MFAVLDAIKQWRFWRQGKRKLLGLSLGETRVLNEYVGNGVSEIDLYVMDATTLALCRKELLYRPAAEKRSPFDVFGIALPHKIYPWVLDYLRANPTCLDRGTDSCGAAG